VTVAEHEDVELGELRGAPVLPALRGTGLVDHAETDALDLGVSHLGQPLPQAAVIVVAPDPDQVVGPFLALV